MCISEFLAERYKSSLSEIQDKLSIDFLFEIP